jgi:DNA-binding NarL/FixJ family response regulator
MSVTILLADDHKIVRDGLRVLLEAQPDLELVGEADDGRATVQLVKELGPDIVVMDVAMPDLNGIEATREILAHLPDVKVLGLSVHSDRQFVAGMLSAGASGYLLKDCAFEELIQAIQAVMAGEIYLSPSVTRIVVEDYVRLLSAPEVAGGSALTPREREVLTLLAQDKTAREIASLLDMSDRTVVTHRQQIMNKLNIHKTTGLVRYAISEGLISVEKR